MYIYIYIDADVLLYIEVIKCIYHFIYIYIYYNIYTHTACVAAMFANCNALALLAFDATTVLPNSRALALLGLPIRMSSDVELQASCWLKLSWWLSQRHCYLAAPSSLLDQALPV